LRLEAVKMLREAGISAGVLAMPILPGLTDSEKDLDALAKAVSEAGAQWFAARVLFLMPASLRQFVPFLEQKFPKLVKQYKAWYGRYGDAPEDYRREITERVRTLRRKYALGTRPERTGTQSWQSPQLQLGFANGG
jgi:DNA repair photolyase